MVTNTTESASNKFALGQNFIRKYNLTIRFTERNDATDNINMAVFIGKTTHKNTIMSELTIALASGFCLLSFLGYFTVIKFRRVKREKIEFKQIQKAAENISAKDARRILNSQKLEAEFIGGKANGQTVNHLKAVTASEMLNQRSIKQRGEDDFLLPMRSTAVFGQMRTRSYTMAI